MTEKLFLPFYNVISAVIYVGILLLIFAVPVLFTTQANASPVFRLESFEVTPADGNDAFFTSRGLSAEGWYRVEYHMSAASRKISPYSYTVEDFDLREPEEYKYNGNYAVFLDEPLSFSSTRQDDFLLTLYVGGLADKDAAERFAENASFGTRGITRHFSFFSDRIPVYVPGFNVSELV